MNSNVNADYNGCDFAIAAEAPHRGYELYIASPLQANILWYILPETDCKDS